MDYKKVESELEGAVIKADPSPREELDFDRDIAKFTPRQMGAIRELDSGNIKFLLYGGCLGGGKSYLIRWFLVRKLIRLYAQYGLTYIQGMLACEDYPTLADRQLTKIEREFPPWLGTHYADHKVYRRCYILAPEYGSGVICFRNLDDPSKYASSEFAVVAVDELTKNKYDVFTDLRIRIRWSGIRDEDCVFLAGSNPGSVGHGWVKQLWMDKSFPEEFYPPVGDRDFRPSFAFVPSKAEDNPHLDAGYYVMLSTLPKSIRKAFRDGDWNTFVGQMFQEWDPSIHVIDPIPVPESAPIYMTFDWGFGAPFSIGWWWVDSDGRLYRFHEWYGSEGPNKGLRMSDDSVVDTVIQIERKEGIKPERVIKRLSGHDSFAKKANPFGGGQGPSTAEVWRKKKITLHPADPNRELKMRQFHNRLAVPDNYPAESPMVLIYRTCTEFIRTLPDLVVDPNRIEDLADGQEDHCYDEAAQIFMARPISDRGSKNVGTGSAATAPPDYFEPHQFPTTAQIASMERREMLEKMKEENEQLIEEVGLWD